MLHPVDLIKRKSSHTKKLKRRAAALFPLAALALIVAMAVREDAHADGLTNHESATQSSLELLVAISETQTITTSIEPTQPKTEAMPVDASIADAEPTFDVTDAPLSQTITDEDTPIELTEEHVDGLEPLAENETQSDAQASAIPVADGGTTTAAAASTTAAEGGVSAMSIIGPVLGVGALGAIAGGGGGGGGGGGSSAPSNSVPMFTTDTYISQIDDSISPEDSEDHLAYFQFSILENSDVASSLGITMAEDANGDTLVYEIIAGNDLGIFTIDEETGEITVADNVSLDTEAYPTHRLTVEVDDQRGGIATAIVDITVENVDELPVLESNQTINIEIGDTITIDSDQLRVSDEESGDDVLVFTIDALPSHGVLSKEGTELAVGETFTQEDINNGHLTFHVAPDVHPDDIDTALVVSLSTPDAQTIDSISVDIHVDTLHANHDLLESDAHSSSHDLLANDNVSSSSRIELASMVSEANATITHDPTSSRVQHEAIATGLSDNPASTLPIEVWAENDAYIFDVDYALDDRSVLDNDNIQVEDGATVYISALSSDGTANGEQRDVHDTFSYTLLNDHGTDHSADVKIKLFDEDGDGAAHGFIELQTANGGTVRMSTWDGKFTYVSPSENSLITDYFYYAVTDGHNESEYVRVDIAPVSENARDDQFVATGTSINMNVSTLLNNDETTQTTQLVKTNATSDAGLTVTFNDALDRFEYTSMQTGLRDANVSTHYKYQYDSVYSAARQFTADSQSSNLRFTDFDGDGDRDAAIIQNIQQLLDRSDFYKNVGSNANPSYVYQAHADTIPVGDTNLQGYRYGDFVDFDGDGREDMIMGTRKEIYLLKNMGIQADGKIHYHILQDPRTINSYPPEYVKANLSGSHSDPISGLFMVNNLHVLIGTAKGNLEFYRIDVSDAVSNYFKYLADPNVSLPPDAFDIDLIKQNTLNSVSTGSADKFLSPVMFDADRDGDFDLVLGREWSGDEGGIRYFENEGGNYVEQTGVDNPFHYASLTFGNDTKFQLEPVDYNRDGLMDLVISRSTAVGTYTAYYENKGPTGFWSQSADRFEIESNEDPVELGSVMANDQKTAASREHYIKKLSTTNNDSGATDDVYDYYRYELTNDFGTNDEAEVEIQLSDNDGDGAIHGYINLTTAQGGHVRMSTWDGEFTYTRPDHVGDEAFNDHFYYQITDSYQDSNYVRVDIVGTAADDDIF